jgi:diguanylate cyclase (GGDEF)-like protein
VGEGNWLSNLIRSIASNPNIGDVMETTLAAAKYLTNAKRAYIFIENQGYRDEPISIYKSLPPSPEAAIREMLCRLEFSTLEPSAVAVANRPQILPLMSRSHLVGAIILEGSSARRNSEPEITMLNLLAIQAAIVLDNLILSCNEWTRLPNLSALKPHLQEALRASTDSIALLFIDIDNFKAVNSLVGYLGGAELLIQFAQRLASATVQEGGVFAHISGDEFVLLTGRLDSGKADAHRTARAIKQVLREPFLVKQQSLFITVSIGISIYPDDAKTVKELLEHSTSAALQAKRAGKGCYRVFCNRGT